MKKMKGVAGLGVSEDAKAMLKHQNLLQDYQELQKETEAKRAKLQHSNDRKLTLSAEVQFLRQRYEFLMKNRAPSSQLKREFLPPTQPKKVTKGKKNLNEKEAVPRNQIRASGINQKAMIYKEKEVAGRKPLHIADLSQRERLRNGKESASRKLLPVIDLNQTAKEEEDFQTNYEALRSEDPTKQHNDMKLSVCRNIGTGSNRTNKRKISWQDQMALRV